MVLPFQGDVQTVLNVTLPAALPSDASEAERQAPRPCQLKAWQQAQLA